MLIFQMIVLFATLWVAQYIYAKFTNQKVLFNKFNACGLLSLGGVADDCGEGAGGIVKAYVADLADLDLDAATLSADGSIITLPYNTAESPYVELVPDDNDQASFQQEGSRNDAGSYSTTQTGNFTFANITAAKYKAAEALVACCNIVVIYEWANGFATVQGLRAVKVNNAYVLRRSVKGAKAIPSVNTNTTALDDNNQVVLQIVNTDNKLAPILFAGQTLPSVIPATTISDLVD
jgi:hypothetical protein